LHPAADVLVQPQGLEVLHGPGERSHSGDHQPGAGLQHAEIAGDRRLRPHVLECLLDRAAIAHAVVDHADPGPAAAHFSVPLVLGIPDSRGSTSIAAASARAAALNAASIMWWTLLPASSVTCMVSRALVASARKNSLVSSWSKLPIPPGGSDPSKPTPVSRWPPPEPSSCSLKRTSVSPVVRSISAVRVMSVDCRGCAIPSTGRAARTPRPGPPVRPAGPARRRRGSQPRQTAAGTA